MKFNKLILAALVSTLFFVSCTNDDANNNYVPKGNYDSGVLVMNEGNFGTDNASVSYISFDLNSYENIDFSVINPGEVIGNTGQSIAFNGNLAYIVVNVSNKIEIVNRYTLKKVGAITAGLNKPRYMAFANGKGYVTNWNSGTGAGTVAIIDLGSNLVTATIPVSDFPNKIIEKAGKLYVAHNDLGQGGNSITVIDPSTNTVNATIAVGDMPDAMAVDGTTLWVSCQGKSSYPVAADESAGKIVKVNLNSNTVTQTFSLTNATDHVAYFEVFGDYAFYVLNSKIYKFPLTASALPTTESFTPTADYIYGFGVKNNKIYVGDAKSFVTNGAVLVYSAGTFGPDPIGTLLATIPVGVAPNGFYFNQ